MTRAVCAFVMLFFKAGDGQGAVPCIGPTWRLLALPFAVDWVRLKWESAWWAFFSNDQGCVWMRAYVMLCFLQNEQIIEQNLLEKGPLMNWEGSWWPAYGNRHWNFPNSRLLLCIGGQPLSPNDQPDQPLLLSIRPQALAQWNGWSAVGPAPWPCSVR